MWKDFFYYSRSERRAVYVLLSLILILLLAITIRTKQEHAVEDLTAEETFAQDSVYKRYEKSFKRSSEEHPTVVEKTYTLFAFDPNSADSIELSALGLSPFVVNNILKYRQKGGHFNTVASMERIYGLTAEKYAELKPYIRIEKPVSSSISLTSKFPESLSVNAVSSQEKPIKYPEGTLVDVGVADTTELKKIPGVGRVIAKNIVTYRNRLGGFYNLEQLLEVKYVTPELLEWFKLDTPQIHKIPVNEANLDQLRSHPYLNFYQAKVILEHRRKRGKIKSLSQLSLYEEFTEKDLKRLSAYFSFD